MLTLDDLVQLEGILFAFEYSDDGELVDYRANMEGTRELAAAAARFCGTITMLCNTLPAAAAATGRTHWVLRQGWTYAAGDWVICAGEGGRGVLAETRRADLPKLHRALVGAG